MNKYFKNIDKQIESNKGKNIFLDANELNLKFIDDTVTAIMHMDNISADTEKVLIDYAAARAIEAFCRMNQYYTFSGPAKNELRKIYADLFKSIKSKNKPPETISKEHYQNLKLWLQKANPFSEKIYAHAGREIKPTVCHEYSVEIQLNVLRIDTRELMQPVLDIGCGKKANLVRFLCSQGIEAYGIDRFTFTENNLTSSDWLEFHYGTEKWGTIISNLGFSNHFNHHNLREDGNYIVYAQKYMEILKSLKAGGSFHYAPDLPFIELYLDKRQFQINKYDIGGFDFKASVVKRVSPGIR